VTPRMKLGPSDLSPGPDFWYENYASQEEGLRGRHDRSKPLGLNDLKNHYRAIVGLSEAFREFHEQRLPSYL
jgi:hypothetical protein